MSHPVPLVAASDLLRSRRAVSAVVCAALGASMTLAFAPFEFWFLSPFVAAAMLSVFLLMPPGLAAGYGFAFGFGQFLSGTYWIYVSVHVFGEAPLWIALLLMFTLVLLLSIIMAAIGYAVALLSRGSAWRLALVGPAVWTLLEWMRGWILTGFPWLSLGYAHVDSPLAGWAPVLGIYGVSWMLLISGAALVAIAAGQGSRLAALVLVAMPWLCGALLHQQVWTEPSRKRPVPTTIVQGGVSQDRKWDAEQFVPTLDLYRNALLDAGSSDLIVWPEVAIPAVMNRIDEYLALLQSDLAARSQTLALGILEPHEDGERVYNSVLLLDGQRRQTYRKRHLVPFGEYFPVPDFVREWMRLLSLPNTDIQRGADRQPLLVSAGGLRLAAAICYEDAYGAEQLYAFPEAEIYVNVSNDAWFGDSVAPHQHLQVARMRSLEVERPMVRATNNGISAFIGHRGTLLETAPQFVFATLTRSLMPRSGLTPYAATGNWPVIGLVTLIALAALYGARSRVFGWMTD